MVVQYLVEVAFDLFVIPLICLQSTVTINNVLKESNLNVFDLLLDVICVTVAMSLQDRITHITHCILCCHHHVVESSAPT